MSEVRAALAASAPTHASDLTEQDPWPGLASYNERDAAYFAAREAECDELEERVLQHRLTVLHGLSGLGKSSLLRAGLFPALRARHFLPVYLRLNFALDEPPLIDQVFAAIEAAARDARAKAPVRQDAETLWEYFQRHGNAFWSARNRLLTPVLAFDQFEEIFTLGAERRADESKAFLEAIADLAEGRAPKAVKARLDRSPAEASRAFDLSRQACRVLLSLREDYLAHLEDLRHLMPTMGNRMRLRPLNGIQAITVVRQPGGSLVTPAVAEEIVAAVAGPRQRQRPTEEQEVDPALLCLLCRELNRRRIKDNAAQINAGMLTEQVRAVILGEFYEEAVGRVSATARRFVEDKLLLASGQRDSVALEVAYDAGVDDAEIEALIAERLVRREERGGVVRLELTHDVLTDVVRASRDQRREREAREKAERERTQAQLEARETQRRLRRSRRFTIAMAVLALVAIGLLGLTVDAYYWATKNFLPPDSMLQLQRFRMGLGAVPEMVLIKKGSFKMGEEGQQTHIEIRKAFSLGKYEVTYDEFDHYVWAQQRAGHDDVKYPTGAAGGRGRQPVVNVDWYEATAYAKWLGERTHQSCRLPNEAEWEYAARAGTDTAYPWGEEPGSRKANFSYSGSDWSDKQSAPVGRFDAYWGLHDMSGNVWEWTCSEYVREFDGSEQRCSAKVEKDNEVPRRRVLRGGSWRYHASRARSPSRHYYGPGYRDVDIGFRVLCSSPIE